MLQHWCSLFDYTGKLEDRIKGRGARYAVETVLERKVALGTCFSEDSDLLSQWRGYAQDGSGFSIAFDVGELSRVAADFRGNFSMGLTKISYGNRDWENVNQVVKLLSSAFGADAEKYQEGGGYGSMSLEYSPEKHAKQHEAARHLFTVKNGSFSEENEWRLFLFDSVSNVDNVEFRESRGILSPYLRVKIPADAIRGVTLGPANRTTRAMVEEALKVYGIECRVSQSRASYRNV